MSLEAVCPGAEKGHHAFLEPLNTQERRPLDLVAGTLQVVSLEDKTFLCFGQSTFHGAFDDSAMEAGEAPFPCQGRISAQQVPVFAAYPLEGRDTVC